MDLIDTAGDWGGTWTVLRPGRKRTVLSAATVEGTSGGALMFRAEEGTPLLVLGPGEWLELQRAVSELPEGAQVFSRG